MKISQNWTAEERLFIIIKMLPQIQSDIYAGYYSEPNRPNITSVLTVATAPASELEQARHSIEEFLRLLT